MLGLMALVLMVLWLLGFLAFHVSAGFMHILLVIGRILRPDPARFHFLRAAQEPPELHPLPTRPSCSS
jgi:hypothetical protein